jgi:N-acetylmuramoyl-L-alanine amidase
MKGTKLIALSLFSIAFLSFTPVNKKLIIIDAGHGGNDMGVKHSDHSEKEIVLKVAQEIQKFNDTQDKYEVILTRDSDQYISLSDRMNKINELNPEIVISLHINSSPQPENPNQGTEIYVQNAENSKKLAEKISNKLKVRSIEERNLHILRESKAPAVLVELGFMNNSTDRNYVSSEKGQKEIAQKFVEVINEY